MQSIEVYLIFLNTAMINDGCFPESRAHVVERLKHLLPSRLHQTVQRVSTKGWRKQISPSSSMSHLSIPIEKKKEKNYSEPPPILISFSLKEIVRCAHKLSRHLRKAVFFQRRLALLLQVSLHTVCEEKQSKPRSWSINDVYANKPMK